MQDQDPQSVSGVHCIHSGQPLTGIASFDVNDGSRIDVGQYDHVLLLYANGSGTTAGACTFTPKDSDTQTGPEFPLDGTGGRPNYVRSFASAADLGSRQVAIPTANLRRYLNVTVAMAATGTIRPAITLIGYGKRAGSPTSIDANVANIGVS